MYSIANTTLKMISIPFEIKFLIVSGCKTDLLSETSFGLIAEIIN